MIVKSSLLASAVLAIAAASPAAAVTNLIVNGSFEAGSPGTGGFTGYTLVNTPDGVPAADQAATVIGYNNTNSYPTGAYTESVAPDNVASLSPDAVGSQAAYFVGDFSVNEAITQLTLLTPGNYRVGFSYYLTNNGLANVGNSSFQGTIIGIPVAFTAIDGTSPGGVWNYASGVGSISLAGFYTTSFRFSSNQFPSKDIVIDRVFAIPTTDPADVIIPPTPTIGVPEPETWALLVIGFGLVGVSTRRRSTAVAA